ncbi:MAG: biopolymer transporter ExbD [Rickettsiales bacterium]|nr:biopolymer transporter ExbD [Rickettsiales bacterium]
MDFDRPSRRKPLSLNLTPLIDVLFILIIFFMLTTSFMRVESMEIILPSAQGKAAASKDVVHIFISANGDMSLGKRLVDQEELVESLERMMKKDANTKVMLLTADGVTIQQLVNIMDRVYLAGGKSLFVRKWQG